MIEILSFVFGGIFRVIPKIMEIYDKQKEREHERLMLDLQMKADGARAQLEMQKLEVQGNITQQVEELRAIVAATNAQAKPAQRTGNWFLDGLLVFSEIASSLVRPLLTYWYCVAAYGAYKVATYFIVMQSGATWYNAVTMLWTSSDHAVMFSIIGFWFVDRAIRKREQSGS